jgi:hypothetical protein
MLFGTTLMALVFVLKPPNQSGIGHESLNSGKQQHCLDPATIEKSDSGQESKAKSSCKAILWGFRVGFQMGF